METISDLCKLPPGRMEFFWKGHRFILLAPLHHAMEAPIDLSVLVLTASVVGKPDTLEVFDAEGHRRAVIGPPVGFQFYYLTALPRGMISVVCLNVGETTDWSDWHFRVDTVNLQLEKWGRSK